MALKVGITGGIGSGKSTICKVFEKLGAPVFEADPVAKRLIDTDPEIRQGLIDLFGPDIYTEKESVDRKKLAEKIFNDEIQLAKVNALVHPAVRAEFLKWAESQDVPYVVHEAAILFESGFYQMMDYTILVTAPEEDRIKRVTMRDGSSREQVIERMNKQWADDEKRKLASIEIKNDNRELILPQIVNIDKQLREYGKIW
ncbi:dephospho-CoA kinase [Maribellus sp. YY47]|uniref:dephospho-CoA kinase n=1 Tax=Maribellus sp. YY47 TaxID=2929486 RepID=UPI0020015649|nr:dephospho-CoA kinase [Maribellus sp. YY47]MCK3684262.1 dephospho-CoA kinase [Maribellus sp. YY47]